MKKQAFLFLSFIFLFSIFFVSFVSGYSPCRIGLITFNLKGDPSYFCDCDSSCSKEGYPNGGSIYEREPCTCFCLDNLGCSICGTLLNSEEKCSDKSIDECSNFYYVDYLGDKRSCVVFYDSQKKTTVCSGSKNSDDIHYLFDN